LEIGGSHRLKNQGSTVGRGWQPFSVSPETAGWGLKCEMGHCHGEAARSVLAKVQGNIFARFHVLATKDRSITQNSQFGLLRLVLQLLYRWQHQSRISWISPRTCILGVAKLELCRYSMHRHGD
jgi:hypothetical protein